MENNHTDVSAQLHCDRLSICKHMIVRFHSHHIPKDHDRQEDLEDKGEHAVGEDFLALHFYCEACVFKLDFSQAG